MFGYSLSHQQFLKVYKWAATHGVAFVLTFVGNTKLTWLSKHIFALIFLVHGGDVGTQYRSRIYFYMAHFDIGTSSFKIEIVVLYNQTLPYV